MHTVIVHIPGPLRAFHGGALQVRVMGRTVGEAMESLRALAPGVYARVIDERGHVRQHVNLFAQDRNTRDLAGLDTPLEDGGDLYILPAVSGGGAVRPGGAA